MFAFVSSQLTYINIGVYVLTKRNRGSGLLYDYQTFSRGLKTFAFTAYEWDDSDMNYVRARPLRAPKEIFELPNVTKFVLLSFARIRPWASSAGWLFRPHTDKSLRAKETESTTAVSIVVFRLGHEVLSSLSDRPIYAVPSVAFDHTKPEPSNHTRWRHLYLRAGEIPDTYRFDSVRQLLIYLSNGIKQMAIEGGGAGVSFRGHQVSTLARSDLFDLAAKT